MIEPANLVRTLRVLLILTAAVTVSTAALVADEDVARMTDQISSGAIWTELRDQECAKAHDIAFGLHQSEHSPAERLDALRTLERCLDKLRIQSRSQLSSKSTTDADVVDAAIANQKAAVAENQAHVGAIDEFRGIRFGVGVGVSHSLDDIISEADIGADNTVRSTKDETTQPRVVLESHYYGFCHSRACYDGRFGVGPFMAIVARDEELISAFGAGVMLGWKDPKRGENDGWSVGIGAVLDANVNSLADGFEDGKPLPAGETEIRFEEKSRWSALLFFTRTF